MSTRYAVIAVLCLGLGSIASARAEGLAIKGQVKGTDGRPLAGAEVRAQRVDTKGSVLVTKTDGKGEYTFRKLDLAQYALTSVINNKAQQVASIKTRPTAWVRVDFDLSAAAKVAKKKRMVWVAGDTSTHIGSGHWEEVDDANAGTGANPMQRINGSILANPNALNPAAGRSGGGN